MTHILYVTVAPFLGTALAAGVVWVLFSDPLWLGYLLIGIAGAIGREIRWRRCVAAGVTPRHWWR